MTPRQADGVLWLWSTSELSASLIAKRLGLTRSMVLAYVYRQRLKGDPRAVSRAPKPPAEQTMEQRIAELERTVAAMRREQRKAA